MRQALSKPFLLTVWGLISLLSALLLFNAQRGGEEELKQRFASRAEIAANFTKTYVRDLLAQERRVAERELADGTELSQVTKLFDYEAAVLLDSRGHALNVVPPAPAVIDQDLAAKYPHLRAARSGATAVSNVIPSAAKGVPIVAFATPFDAKRGRRVFSGAFDVAGTPIGAFLRNASPFRSARVYVIDAAGVIVAGNHRQVAGRSHGLAKAAPDIAAAMKRSTAGQTTSSYEYVSKPVAGTSWRLVMAVPAKDLLAPVRGFGRYVPWMMWAGFVLGALACALLMAHLVQSRRKLHQANDRLDRLARIDDLTDLPNRRQAQATLDAAVSSAARHDHPLSVLMIDIDKFKEINDTFGHEAGDDVLRSVAATVAGALRTEDLAGRWGGEEFLAVLPETDLGGASRVAERVREAVAGLPIILGDQTIAVTVSVGAAARVDQESDSLVAAADFAMYLAKQAGRDAVHAG